MSQSPDEKRARYQVIQLMTEGKADEAGVLLDRYSAQNVISPVYVEFYTSILEEIRRSEAVERAVEAAHGEIKNPQPVEESVDHGADARTGNWSEASPANP